MNWFQAFIYALAIIGFLNTIAYGVRALWPSGTRYDSQCARCRASSPYVPYLFIIRAWEVYHHVRCPSKKKGKP